MSSYNSSNQGPIRRYISHPTSRPNVIPRRSGVHRIAAIALFRELLRAASFLPLDGGVKRCVQNVVRNRFRANRFVQSKRLLGIAFTGGLEALEILDGSVNGSTQSFNRLQTLLAQIPASLKGPPPAVGHQRRAKKIEIPVKPNGYSILSRPRQSLPEGKQRKVPSIELAQGLPFLRIKKPQPRSLSIYLNNKVLEKQAGIESFQWLGHHMIPLAETEDMWDEILEAEFGPGVVEHEGEDSGEEYEEIKQRVTFLSNERLKLLEGTWAARYVWMWAVVYQRNDAQIRKNRAMYARMKTIVQQEQMLKDEEEQSRRLPHN